MPKAYNTGMFIVIDAIDGAGKGTLIRGIADHLAAQGKRVFDLVSFMQTHQALPETDNPDLAKADVLLSAEPTFCWIGSAIREEAIRSHADRAYDAQTIARLFSEDRLILSTRVILPFLAARADRWVIQDRGCITSLAYQPLDAMRKGDTTVTEAWVAALPGNALELSHAPDLLLLLRLAPEEAMHRLDGRADKRDHAAFETLLFQQQLAARYRDPSVLKPYRETGTRIVEINAAQTPEQVLHDALNAIR